MKILGIDPGTATTGYGVIESKRGKLTLIEYGCILTKKGQGPAKRLGEIHRDLDQLIKKRRPRVLACETLFFYKNITTAISVAQARGIVLLAAYENRLEVVEISPLEVKKTLTNYGRADKKQMQYMVTKLLGLKNPPQPDDAADALAVAICAANALQ